MHTRSVTMNHGDVLDARTFHACTGELGSSSAQTSTFQNSCAGEFEFDPENPWLARRIQRTVARIG